MSFRDISDHIQQMYDVEISHATLSEITERVIPQVKEWQSRPLESLYTIVWLDAMQRTDFYGLCKHTSIIFVIFLPVMHHRADTMDEFVANGIQNGHFVLAFSDLSQIIVLNFAARAAPL